MSRRVKDFIEICDLVSLDDLIARLSELRESLPADSEAELKLQGDDIFGRTISITYFRPQTDEEAECERRYAGAYREARERELDKLQQELGVVCRAPGARRKLRIVA